MRLRSAYQIIAMFGVLFAVCCAEIYFEESFGDGDGWKSRWIHSESKRNELGAFVVGTGDFFTDKEFDKGLQTTENNHYYAISAPFKSFSNAGKELVVQYTVKHQQKLDCGGSYLKLLSPDIDPKTFDKRTPFVLMFGPDVCGETNQKIMLILKHNGQEAKWKKTLRHDNDESTHVYTLRLFPNDTYTVSINGRLREKGSLEKDFTFTSLSSSAKKAKKSEGLSAADGATKTDLHAVGEIGAVGIEVWQVNAGSVFDNILITDDHHVAESFVENVYRPMAAAEVSLVHRVREERREKLKAKAILDGEDPAEYDDDYEDDEDDGIEITTEFTDEEREYAESLARQLMGGGSGFRKDEL
eukprot:TRINITY_DN5732_c0_g1_i1.p1 TRINITY_DN5732_c0_g1~~TRINITY_DN5732_c0_g1_i1.p1  ORF type:complete len:357 (-),score=93.40 TRINITY_DN5732_c0_g1_i1:448-1518(-)